MGAVQRVSLRPALEREPAGERPVHPLLDPRGPIMCVGGSRGADNLSIPVRPGAATLFGPRAACVAGSGSLWVSDTGHHRVLGWRHGVFGDDAHADVLIGQPDFSDEGRNAKGAAGAATLNVPTGITPCGEGIAVADAWNHRVLIWHRLPERHNALADVVLGQADFTNVDANRGNVDPAADTLFWPYGVSWDGAHLWVADTGNRRVLMWNGLPLRNGRAADLVLGQPGFCTRDENAGRSPDAASMRWPHGLARWGARLCVADAGNNRIMVWDAVPTRNDQRADFVLGQSDERGVDNNQSRYWPAASSLNMPYGIAAAHDWLLVADTANSRLIGWHARDAATGATARALTGQPDFAAKGDNRWQLPQRDSLCWPYGIACRDGVAVVADSGNNRVVLWRLAEEASA